MCENQQKQPNNKLKGNNEYKHHITFIVTTSILILGYAAFSIWTNCQLKNVQTELVKTQQDHIHSVDSLYCNLITSVKANGDSIRTILLTQRNLKRGQLSKLVQQYSYEDCTAQLHKDMPSLKSEILDANNIAKEMIKLHLDKVEHEYTNITIWAAVLTILFLVFSFYSVFQLERYKDEAKEMIKEIEINGTDKINKIEEKGRNATTLIDAQLNNLQTFVKKTNDDYTGFIKDKSIQFNNIVEKQQSQIDDLLALSRNDIEIIKKNKIIELDELHQTSKNNLSVWEQSYRLQFESFVDKYKEILDKLSSDNEQKKNTEEKQDSL